MTRNEFVHQIMAGLWSDPEASVHDFERALKGAQAFADMVAEVAPFDTKPIELEAKLRGVWEEQVGLAAEFVGLREKLAALEARTRPPSHRE